MYYVAANSLFRSYNTTRLPLKDGTSETTVRYLFDPFLYIHGSQKLLHSYLVKLVSFSVKNYVLGPNSTLDPRYLLPLGTNTRRMSKPSFT